MNKKGLELAFNVIVIMVLALLLLAGLIYFFMTSSSGFFSEIKNYFSESNVDGIIDSCNNLVAVNSAYEFCCVNKEVKLSKEDKFSMTCSNASLESWGSKINKIGCEGVC
ncbi:MAG: hypothetical protein WC781_02940 [Candidatus Pacearchaeota archaeon]|jgi:hypothetical protein